MNNTEKPRLGFATGRIWGRALRISFAERAAYRGDFILSLLVTLLFELVTPLVTLLIYGTGSSFPGWSMREALLIQSVFLLARGIAFPCFFGMVFVVFRQVVEGTFELTLLKPRSALLVTVTRGFDVEGFGRLAGGIGLFAWVLSGLPAPGALQWLAFVGLLTLSVLVLFSFALFLSASLFIWVGNGRVQELLDSILVFSQYPGSIFNAGFQLVLAVVIPVGMIGLFPAEMLLGRPSPLLLWSIPACLAFAGLALLVWNRTLKQYAGGGG